MSDSEKILVSIMQEYQELLDYGIDHMDSLPDGMRTKLIDSLVSFHQKVTALIVILEE